MPKLHFAVALTAAACVAACGPSSKDTSEKRPDPLIYKQLEISNLKARLRDPDSAIISREFMSDNASGQPTLCGYVNSKNALGGMTGPQRFIAGAVVGVEEDFAPGEMDRAWVMLCSKPIKE